MVADPEESEMEQICNVKDLSEDLEGDTVAVFMMATYGEGDPTDNAQEFFDWLKDGGADLKGAYIQSHPLNGAPDELFDSVSDSVFGLSILSIRIWLLGS